MNFWKTTFWASCATTARLISHFIVAKLIAEFSGPIAFATLGQFQSFITLVQLGAGGIVSGGVTKYTAEYHNQPDKLKQLIETALRFGFYASIITGVLIAIFSKNLSLYIFQTTSYWWILVVFGLTLFGYTLNQLFLSVFNGLNLMRKYASLSVYSGIFSITLIGVLCYYFSVNGVLLGSVLIQIFLFIVGIIFIKDISVTINLVKNKIDYQCLRNLLTYSVMPVTSIFCISISQMTVRNYVAYHSSWEDVGYWQAIIKISDAYLMIMSMIITTYVFPKYSTIFNNHELKKEVMSVFFKIVPITSILALSIYLCRHMVVLILFSEKFIVTENLFFYQLLGDIVKIASLVIGNILLAKMQIKIFILFELIFTSSFVLLSITLYNLFNLQGLTIAFLVNYILYFSVVLIWFLRFVKNESMAHWRL